MSQHITHGKTSPRTALRGEYGYSLRARAGRWYVRIRRPGAGRWAEEAASRFLPGSDGPCLDCEAGQAADITGCQCQKALRRAVDTHLEGLARVWQQAARSERLAEFRALHLPDRARASSVESYATLGEVLRALETAEEEARRSSAALLNAKTCRAYRVALVRLGRSVLGANGVLSTDGKRVRLGADELSSVKTLNLGTLCTADAVKRLQCEVQEVTQPNYRLEHPSHGGCNTTIRCAICALAAMARLAPTLRVPDLTSMRSVPDLAECHHGFVPWPAGVVDTMDAAASALREKDFELWKVHVLLRRAGLRDVELLGARRDWLEEVRPGVWQLVLCWRDNWQLVKRGKVRRIGLDAETVEALRGLPAGAWLVGDGMTETSRLSLIYRAHSQWLRQFIPDRQKTNHELRKLAGSEVYMRDGLQAAAYFLGDSVQTAERHYASYLGAILPLHSVSAS
jgi:hypothetical protein